MKTWQQLKTHPELIDKYRMRERVFSAIREFFAAEGFLEVETPLLVPVPSIEPNLEVFETNLLDERRRSARAFLITSPEYALKKLLAAGLPKIFQLAKCFRNAEGRSRLHNLEFTMLEWYRTQTTYTQIMKDCENLLCHIARKCLPTKHLSYQGNTIDLSAPWERISVRQAFKKYAQVSVFDLFEKEQRSRIARQKGYSVDETTTGEELFHQIFLNEIEPKLGFGKPTILYDYPSALSSLARVSPKDASVVERFEFYICGIELGNAFSELTDEEEQRNRFQADHQERQKLGKTEYPLDEEFLDALESGIPECAGIAVGVDRIVMLFADVPAVAQTLFFPVDELFPGLNSNLR